MDDFRTPIKSKRVRVIETLRTPMLFTPRRNYKRPPSNVEGVKDVSRVLFVDKEEYEILRDFMEFASQLDFELTTYEFRPLDDFGWEEEKDDAGLGSIWRII